MFSDQDLISGYRVNRSWLDFATSYKVKSVCNSWRFPGSCTNNVTNRLTDSYRGGGGKENKKKKETSCSDTG